MVAPFAASSTSSQRRAGRAAKGYRGHPLCCRDERRARPRATARTACSRCHTRVSDGWWRSGKLIGTVVTKRPRTNIDGSDKKRARRSLRGFGSHVTSRLRPIRCLCGHSSGRRSASYPTRADHRRCGRGPRIGASRQRCRASAHRYGAYPGPLKSHALRRSAPAPQQSVNKPTLISNIPNK